MSPKISYKNILKASLATVILVTGFLAILIWAFGDKTSIQTEIVRQPNISNFEEFKKVLSPAENNLTDDISKVIAKEIAELNPEGPFQSENGSNQIAAINPDELVNKTIQEGLKNFNPDKLRYSAVLADIHTSQSNIKESQAQYFESINNSIKTAFENSATMNYAYPEQTNFSAIIANYETAIAKLYRTEVPSDLLSYHINLISLLGTHKNVYAVMANLEEDPLQAYLAAEFGLQVESELAFLAVEINNYIDAHQIFEA